DEVGTKRIADAFRMWHVYYPATLHLRTKRGFGNAVLSRWPIVEDSKIILPNVSLVGRTQRTATAATIQFGSDQVRVYSTHLSTPFDVTPGARRAQLRAILEDAKKFRAVVIGGDMNSGSIGEVARDAGYYWPTERGPRTTRGGRWDHIFLKGLKVPDGTSAGTINDVRGSSDHRPVWATALVR
ncbi:MAG TPA: endonuclease/exonuclease/phosphatase family protein, partial [Gemmatimonadaceae bacterium]|nr:endonuclease/exonuclease/phosphatase family protein [Gemmatimonadaceae bacterium]